MAVTIVLNDNDDENKRRGVQKGLKCVASVFCVCARRICRPCGSNYRSRMKFTDEITANGDFIL